MKVPHNTLATSMQKHLFELKGLGAVGRNKMHFYRQAKREIRRNAGRKLPLLLEGDENEDARTFYTSSSSSSSSLSSSSSPAYEYHNHRHIDGKMSITYKGVCIGTFSAAEFAKYEKWERKIERRERRGWKRAQREKRKEKVKAWVGRVGRWMGGKVRAASTRVLWQDCGCGR